MSDTPVKQPPAAKMTRKECAHFLTDHGHPVSVRLLNEWSFRKIGPPHVKVSRCLTLYDPDEVLAWAAAKETFPFDRNVWKTRHETAELLKRAGYHYRRNSLTVLACLEEGPPFVKYNGRVYYDRAVAVKWARDRYRRIKKRLPRATRAAELHSAAEHSAPQSGAAERGATSASNARRRTADVVNASTATPDR